MPQDPKSASSPLRAPETPTKYTDVAFANRVAKTTGKSTSVMSNMMATVKAEALASSQTTQGTNPGR